MIWNALLENCDWQCYLDRYQDLQETFGNDLSAVEDHWNNEGRSEGLDCTCGNSVSDVVSVAIAILMIHSKTFLALNVKPILILDRFFLWKKNTEIYFIP